MGRRAQGYKIRKRKGRPYEIRFTREGREWNLGLGTHDAGEAAREAERLFADIVRGVIKLEERVEAHPKAVARTGRELRKVGDEWLAHSTGKLRPKTKEIYRVYLATIARGIPTMGELTTPNLRDYVDARLQMVRASSVRKELSALAGLITYAHSKGYLPEPPTIPTIEKHVEGVNRVRRRVAADYLSEDEVRQIIEALPEMSRSKRWPNFPVKARFVFQYESNLRPEFVNVISVPEHYRKGQKHIRIPPELDKKQQGRSHPLTPAAREAIDSVCPAAGLVFGKHDYRAPILKAALAVLPEEKARRFCGQHLRSARITHLLQRTGNIMGVMRLSGHTRLETTSRYARPNDQAALEVIEALSEVAEERKRGRWSGRKRRRAA